MNVLFLRDINHDVEVHITYVPEKFDYLVQILRISDNMVLEAYFPCTKHPGPEGKMSEFDAKRSLKIIDNLANDLDLC